MPVLDLQQVADDGVGREGLGELALGHNTSRAAADELCKEVIRKGCPRRRAMLHCVNGQAVGNHLNQGSPVVGTE